MSTKAVSAILAAFALIMLAVTSFAEPNDEPAQPRTTEAPGLDGEEIKAEIDRQTRELDLSEWQSYFEELRPFSGAGSARELIERCSQGSEAELPNSLLEIARELIRSALSGVRGALAMLTAAGLITGLAEVMPRGGARKFASLLLSAAAAALTASAFSSLCASASASVGRTAGFTEAALPVMTLLLSAVGANASSGALRPLMLFLSGSVVPLIQRLVLPLILAGGIVGILDGLTDDGALSGIFKLIESAVKWILAIAAVVYTGVCVAQGMTVAAVDGVSIRTAKFAIDRLLPSTGGLIGGSVDTFMSCALLVKNGAGMAALIIMLGILARPLAVLGAGVFAFRASAALIRPAAASGTFRMLSCAADMAGHLFAATAVAGAMFAVTMLVFITAGGVSAGLW